jgi:hypothetical protein
VLAHRCCLRELPHPDELCPATAEVEQVEQVVVPVQELAILPRTRERYQAISELPAGGASVSAIARTLGLDRHIVRRFIRACGLAELQAKTLQRASLLDGYTNYLHRRWSEGATDVSGLTQEITALGYRVSAQTVRRYLHPLRDGRPMPPARPAAPTVREVTGWILRRPDTLEPGEQVRLQQVLAHCPQLDAAATRAAAFAEMMCGRHGERLDDWLIAVAADDLPELRRFTTGLRGRARRPDPRAQLRPVEGTVNKIKC